MTLERCEPQPEASGGAGGDLTPEGLFRFYGPPVLAICLANVRNLHDAEDIMQEVFIKALRKLDALRDPLRAKSWLIRIARRACADHYRRRDPETQVLRDDVAARSAVGNHLADRLHHAIQGLPQEYREAITLYYIDGRNSGGVAACLGITEAATRQRLVRARLMLHDLLREEKP